jgi:hypothetical protein
VAASALTLAATGLVGTTTPAPVAATPQGPLPTADPTIVFDGDRSRWVSLSGSEVLTQPSAACNPDDPSWTKPGTSTRFAHLPYRTGTTPEQLSTCWAGDAFPAGPGAWASATQGSVAAPSVAEVPGAWLLLYSATRAGSTQRCIGLAYSNTPSGPGWYRADQPLICPDDGSSATDPELFHDRVAGQWFVLWTEHAATGCSSTLMAQQLDVATAPATRVGASRRLLGGTHASVRFDETPAADCPGGVRHRLESPTMIRAERNPDRQGPAGDDQLWLLFSANDRSSANHATGWALCGTDGPAAGGECVPINQLDPAWATRPLWGSSARTPLVPFPDVPGFGGMSLAVPDPTLATGPADPGPDGMSQPVYAVAQQVPAGGGRPTQVLYRLDTTDSGPDLFEPEAVTWHGAGGTFGGLDVPGARTPSGHTVATRDASALGGTPFRWPAGRSGVFNARTADGTLILAGDNQNGTFAVPTADDMVLGSYQPRTSQWSTINLRTCTADSTRPRCEADGATTLPRPPGGTTPAGTSVADVETIDGGRAVAFTAVNGYPPAYDWRPATNGIWPTFGIVSQVDGQWKVASGPWGANQWTGGQLAGTNDAVGRLACPTDPGKYPSGGESICQGANELAELPASGDIIVAQYLGTGTSGALMALHYEGPFEGGRYDVSIKGYYKYPTIPNHQTADPDDTIAATAKEVYVDPTGTEGDERFSLAFDLYPAGETPNVIQEFTYDSGTGEIRPATAPILHRNEAAPGQPLQQLGTAHYDRDGNLWAGSDHLVVYAKGTGSRSCGFVPGKALGDYTTQVGDTTYWGQTCEPDHEIAEARTVAGGFPGQITHDPYSRTVVFLGSWTPGVVPIRYAGTGTGLTVTVGQIADTGAGRLQGGIDQRPPVFDRTGRMWWTRKNMPPEGGPTVSAPHWVAALDVNQLFG